MSQVIQNTESTRNFLKNTLKDNLLQFVLLFAAVTLGFFAENLKDENAQRKLGIKLTHARVADLKQIEDKGDGKLLPILTRALKKKIRSTEVSK
jgi:hypothetical protein